MGGGLYPPLLLPKGTLALLIISALCCWSCGCFQAQAQLCLYQKAIFSFTLNGLEGPAASYQSPNSSPLSAGAEWGEGGVG